MLTYPENLLITCESIWRKGKKERCSMQQHWLFSIYSSSNKYSLLQNVFQTAIEWSLFFFFFGGKGGRRRDGGGGLLISLLPYYISYIIILMHLHTGITSFLCPSQPPPPAGRQKAIYESTDNRKLLAHTKQKNNIINISHLYNRVHMDKTIKR